MSYRSSHVGDGIGAEYDQDFWDQTTARGLNWLLEREILARVLASAGIGTSSSALDFACGTGRVLSELERHVDGPLGVDVSDDMLAVARRRCPRATVLTADVTAAPDAVSGPFDLITAFRFFLNAEPALRHEVLEWMRAAMAPGGLLVVNFHLNPHSARGAYLRLRWRGRWQTPVATVRQARDLLTGAGFVVTDVIGYDYLPYRRDGSRVLAPRIRARIERFLLARRMSPAIASCFVVVVRNAVDRPAVRSAEDRQRAQFPA